MGTDNAHFAYIDGPIGGADQNGDTLLTKLQRFQNQVDHRLTAVYVEDFGSVGTSDDTTVVQAALNAAKSQGSVRLIPPLGAQMTITEKLQLNNAQNVVFGSDAADGYALNDSSPSLIWGGDSGATMLEMIGSGGCEIRAMRLDMGTANLAINIDSVALDDPGVSTSNILRALQIKKASSDANTLGIGISLTSTNNNERMQIYNCAAFFGGSTDPSNTDRGTFIQIGADGGFGVNAKNVLIAMCYWFGASYGVVPWNSSEIFSLSCESNYASIDYLINSAKATIIRHHTESARQFVKGRDAITLRDNLIGFGGWDNDYPIVQMCLPSGSAGSGKLIMVGNEYVAQDDVNAVDADSSGNYFINDGAGDASNNSWPNTTPSFSNFVTQRSNAGVLGLKPILFADLATYASQGQIAYVSDGTPGSNPLTGSGSGCLATYEESIWKAMVTAPASGGSGIDSVEFATVTSLGSLRDNFSGLVGFSFTTGDVAPIVTHLGAVRSSGNSHTHDLRLYKIVSSSSLTLLANPSIDLSTGTVDALKYVKLPLPIQLEPNTQYGIYLKVVDTEDQWRDYDTVLSPASIVTFDGPEYSTDDGATTNTIPSFVDHSFGPVSFKYLD